MVFKDDGCLGEGFFDIYHGEGEFESSSAIAKSIAGT